ncbi:MAG: hypothetical protein KAI79_15090 [Bacteroidales bacterium]|nr:hypothetical protein [Bacteroidales bacterium]
MKNIGQVRVNPSDYVIRLRRGKIYKQGLGMNFFTIPSEQYVIIPTSVSKIPFLADQITKENQGVEVSGFAIWKIGVPDKTYLHFDFSKVEAPIETINTFLKDVVESAIRHQVANMTIEEVLRKRGSIILQLKQELEYISNQWGISIETIEIKNVKIMSEQLFHNMQAKYRDHIRLESETSALKTNQEIAEHQIKHNEEIASLEQEAKLKEYERKNEVEKIAIEKQSAINKLRANENKQQELLDKHNELELFENEQKNKQSKITAELETIESEKKLLEENVLLRLTEKENKAKLNYIDLEVEQKRIMISNMEDAKHILYKNLDNIISSLDITELNIGQSDFQQLIKEFKKQLKK